MDLHIQNCQEGSISTWCGNSTVGRVSEKLMHNTDAGSSPLCACIEIFYQKSTNEEEKKKEKKRLHTPSLLISPAALTVMGTENID